MGSLGLLYCETLQREITDILASEAYPLLLSRSFSRHCMKNGTNNNPLTEPLGYLTTRCDRILIIGCGCMHGLSTEVLDSVEIIIPDLFRDILFPESFVDEQRKMGAYCMVPDNFLRFADFFSCQGFDDTTLATFLAESIQSIILADTGSWKIPDEFIQKFFSQYQVPVTVIPVGIKPISGYIRVQYLEWFLLREQEEHTKHLLSARKKTADYAMMVDLLGGITLATQEQQVIRIITDLVSMLFSPREIGFLPVSDEKIGPYVSFNGDPFTAEDELRSFLTGQDDSVFTSSGDGFFLRIRYDLTTVGILYAAGFTLPEYRHNYLDLGIFIAKVCGLAITNARIFEKLKDTIDKLNQEIFEREKAELALRESEEHYRSLFENMLEGFAYCQMLYDDDQNPSDWIYLSVNSSFDQITGLSGVQGKRATEVFPGIRDSSPELFKIYSRVAETGVPEMFETYFSHLSIWLRISVYQPRVDHFVAVFENITARKQTEEDLKKVVRDHQTILENVPSMILFKDTQNRYIKVNPAAARMIGKPIEEIEGKTYSELFPDGPDPYYHHDFAVITTKIPDFGVIEQITAPQGEHLWVQTDTVPLLDDAGDVIGLLVVSTDITESKRVKDALSQINHKLNLLSGITRHDISNEIQILFGYLDLAGLKGIPSELQEDFSIMKEAVHHIERQIAFTRDYQDIGIHTPQWQNVRDVIRHTQKSINISPIEVKIEFTDVEIFADPLIIKVFFNLMDNARRYGEKITWIRFFAETRGTHHIIICEDNGAGIPDEYKSKIFNREYFKHTGFGLNLSREILDITNISIRETGIFGTGARFEMDVPEGNWRYVR